MGCRLDDFFLRMEYVVKDFPTDIGQAEIATRMAVG